MKTTATNGRTVSKTRVLAGTAVFTAIVIVLQLMGSFVRFGPFSISLVLVPIVIGSALYGFWSGAWLGFMFGVTVLLSGDAAAFLTISPIGTILTCTIKGAAAGLCAGLVYRLLCDKSETAATAAAAVICPVVNTGIFLIGCLIFFMGTITEWAGGSNVGRYMITGLVGLNFVFEMLVNVVLCPVIVRLIRAAKSSRV